MHRMNPVADGCGGCLLRILVWESFLAPFSGLPNGAKAQEVFSAKLTPRPMCSGHRPAGIPLKGAFHLQPRNGDTDRSPQPRYMRVRQERASDPLNTRDVTKTTRPACAKSHASRNASRRRVKFCRRRFQGTEATDMPQGVPEGCRVLVIALLGA